MSVTAALAKHLAANGYGTEGVNIFVGGLHDGPSDPDQQMTLGLYDGVARETFTTVEPQSFVQVMLRGNPGKHLQAEVRAMEVWRFLTAIRNVTITGVVVEGTALPSVSIQVVRPLGVLRPLRPDENQRPLTSINLEVTQ